jgi:Icc-related predicted phosphoesterase
MTLRVVALSDTHGWHHPPQVPEGDVLIHAGDCTHLGRLDQLARFNDFLGRLPHRHKLVVAGNHDFCFARQPEASRACLTQATYLQDQAVTIEGFKFYGSPWQPVFHNMAFNLPRGPALRAKWDLIPTDTDVLITHTPPWGRRDQSILGRPVGCQDLGRAVERLPRLRLHAFGHVHEAAGEVRAGKILFVNAAVCNFFYLPVRRAVVCDLEPA